MPNNAYTTIVAVILLAAVGGVGLVVNNHREVINRLEQERTSLQDQIDEQADLIGTLEERPSANPQQVGRLIAEVRVDLEELTGRVTDIENDMSPIRWRLDDVEYYCTADTEAPDSPGRDQSHGPPLDARTNNPHYDAHQARRRSLALDRHSRQQLHVSLCEQLGGLADGPPDLPNIDRR